MVQTEPVARLIEEGDYELAQKLLDESYKKTFGAYQDSLAKKAKIEKLLQDMPNMPEQARKDYTRAISLHEQTISLSARALNMDLETSGLIEKLISMKSHVK